MKIYNSAELMELSRRKVTVPVKWPHRHRVSILVEEKQNLGKGDLRGSGAEL